MLGNRWTVWKVLAMPSFVIWFGVNPTRLCSPKTMSPPSGAYSPVITLKTVLLPAPFGPMMLRISPRSTTKSRPLSA